MGNDISRRWRWSVAAAASGPKTERYALEQLEDRRMLAVVISEFMADNEATIADEDGDFSDWIEIRNTGPDSVDLGGWYLTDKANNLTKWVVPTTQIAAGDQILVFASEKDRRTPGTELHTNFKLSNEGEFLALVRSDGVTVEYGFDPAFLPQNQDVSYGLSADGTTEGFFTDPTPGQPNGLAPVANPSTAVLINEIMYSLPRDGILDAENTDEEFIELYNRGTNSVDLTGWKFTRGIEFEFPEATMPVGGYLVVAANAEAFQVKYPQVDNVVGGWLGKLSNSGENIELVDDKGNVVDSVDYASEGDWSVRAVGPDDRGSNGWIWSAEHDGGNKSLELVNVSLPSQSGQNWRSSIPDGGTPGQPNSTAQINTAPLISEVIHSPAIPQADDAVVITARLTDELAGATAQLHWKVDTANEFAIAAMVDNGQAPDTLAGDNLFVATIPSHADRTVIEFYVEAIDVSNHRRTWPAPTAEGSQSVNALYQVIDEFDQDASWNPESVPVYFQVMTTAERNEFAGTVRQSDAQYNATFISIDGSGVAVRYNAGVRYRGSASRNDRVPPNRINFPDDRPWQGVTRINMNPSSPVNNVAGAALFRLAGVEMADARGVRMLSNGVDLNSGLYAHVEVLDSDYAEVHNPQDSEGNIYRGRRPDESPEGGLGAGLRYFGSEAGPYVSYVKNTNASEANWSDVIRLTDVLNNSPDATYVQDVLQVANVEQWFRAFAMNSLLGNNENGLFTGDGQGDDYAMYRGVADPRFTMIPYDLDSLFVTGGFGGGRINAPLAEPAEVPALNRLINHPAFRQQFYAQYLDLIDNVLLTDSAEEALRQTLRGIASEGQIQAMLDFIRQRADFVRGEINQRVTISADAGTVSGLPRTNSAVLTLSGEAPEAATVSMMVNDHPVERIDAERNWIFNVAGGQVVESETLIAAGSSWKYLDDGSDQGIAWRQPGFDDGSWQEGRAQLGYGDGDETTQISNGPGQGNAATSYFRATFTVTDLAKADFLSLRMVYDDAAAVYINGSEVVRTDNLSLDATYDTFATNTHQMENSFVSFDVGSEALVAGENAIAVEVHQASATSSDVSFDLELTAIDVQTIDIETPPDLKLFPGLNRYTVHAFAGMDGSGALVGEEFIDVWYDDGTTQAVADDIISDTTWAAEDGPYLISSDVTVQAGASLTIQPGTTVFFADNGRLTVRGRLWAIGRPFQEIRFTRQPGASGWNGLQFRDSTSDNRIEHAIIEYGVTNDGMVGLENSSLTLERVVLDHTDRRRIRSIDSSLVVRNSTFTNIFDPGEAPTTNNLSEHIWGSGVPAGGQWILENNLFGHITGHNDSIDFDASRLPNPIPIIRNNLFVGGGDDALDMTGDVWVEGNTFQNFIKDEFNNDPGESNTISASSGEFWVMRNVFRNVQHASLIKEDAFMHFLSNTVVDAESAPLYFDLPGQTSGPGRGAIVENSIFARVPTTFDQIQVDTDLTVSHSYLTDDARQFDGNGNLFGDPHVNADGLLATGSFAMGAGSDGQDMGAAVNPGATVSGVPGGITASRDAAIHVGGAAITHYRYRLDNGAYSQEFSTESPIQLFGLADGTHLLSVVGKNELGIWQEEASATTVNWTVDANFAPRVVISEILADNQSVSVDGLFPDVIELYNPNSTAIDLSNYSITDDPSRPDRFVFPVNTVLGAAEYLTLIADTVQAAHLAVGFSLSAAGEGVYLFDRSPAPVLVDSVEFGFQLPDLSISRLGSEMAWGLSVPTVGTSNRAHPVADSSSIVINEWYASGSIRVEEDFVELYNPALFPADIGGHFLSDRPFAIPQMSEIPPLSFIGAGGFTPFVADGVVSRGPDHLAFRLSPELEQIGFFAPDQQRIDVVFSPPQTSEISMGRVPDGSTVFNFLPIPTPDATNGSVNTIAFGFDWNAEWKYDASGTDLGTQWRNFDFDDAEWQIGRGPLGQENETLAEPILTEFSLGEPTYYFRRQFSIPDGIQLEQISATITTQVDDGFVVYLNGHELIRRGMPNGEITFNTLAARSVNEAQLEGPFDIPGNLLLEGTNVFGVEVHQTRIDSSDLVFGLRLDASATVAEGTDLPLLDRSLRISEIMYNSAGGQALDFIELTNISDQPLDLTGVRLSNAIDFIFPSVVLPPHQFVVVAEDAVAFTNRYGANVNLVGEYAGNLSNGGETIALQFADPFDAAILRFAYRDDWYPETDGQGRSLEILDPNLRFDRWSTSAAWRASSVLGGTPGSNGPAGNLPGDLNSDQVVDVQDIDLLCGGIYAGAGDFDLDGNGAVQLADLEFLVERILGTAIGDVNLDGVFNSGDLVAIFRMGEYEDGIDGNSTWVDGDWNCDGEFSTGDLVYAFKRGSYSRASVATGRAPLAAALVDSTESMEKSLDETEADAEPLVKDPVQPEIVIGSRVADLVFSTLQSTSKRTRQNGQLKDDAFSSNELSSRRLLTPPSVHRLDAF